MEKSDNTDRMSGHNRSSINDCRLFTLKKHHHANGNLTSVSNCNEVPFDIKRTFYIYDVPGGAERGGHSHYRNQQFIVAISGCFDVTIDDGTDQYTYTLNRPYQGLLVAPGIWNRLHNFSSGSVCLVLNSDHFEEDDYVRDYEKFLELKRNNAE